MTQEIKLGNIVEDKVTNLRGYAYQFFIRMNGNRLVGVQPVGDGKTVPEMIFVDDFVIDVVGDGLPSITPDEVSITMGSNVKEIASGRVGVVTGMMQFMNGCVNIEVTPKTKDNEQVEGFWVDHNRLEVVGAGVSGAVKTADTGGPMVRGRIKSM